MYFEILFICAFLQTFQIKTQIKISARIILVLVLSVFDFGLHELRFYGVV